MKQIIFTAIALGMIVSLSHAEITPREVKRIAPGYRGTVVVFVSSVCPCTDAHRLIVNDLVASARPQGFEFYLVFSNQGETKDRIQHFYRSIGWDIPYLTDSRGTLAEKYHATHTPEAFVLGTDNQLLYNGPIDDSNKNQGRVDHAYLNEAVGDILAGRPVATPRIEPTGCWIVTRASSLSAQTGGS